MRVGRAVAASAEAESVKERTSVPSSVPSVLGLSQAQGPDRSLDYLLEDEPAPGRKRIYLAVVLVVAAVALLGWRWRHSGYFSHTQLAGVSSQPGTTTNSPDVSAPSASTSPSGAVPASSSNSDSANEVSPTDASHGSAHDDKSSRPASALPNNETTKPTQPAPIPDSEQNSNPSPEDSATSAAKSDAPSTTATTPIPVPTTTPPPVIKAAPKIAKEPAAAATPAASEQDLLVAEGEKYLYGNGVLQNCARAEKSLLAAALHASPKAESVLGTMYATGHCVGRDLPTAYRWFAKASHQDPNNARIARDLEVLWKQMTAGERQLAVNSRE